MAWARSSTRACCGATAPDDEPRYRMLEPIREFALERLETAARRRRSATGTRAPPRDRRERGATPHVRSPAPLARPAGGRPRQPARRARPRDGEPRPRPPSASRRAVAVLADPRLSARGRGRRRSSPLIAGEGFPARPGLRQALEALGGLTYWHGGLRDLPGATSRRWRCGGRTATPRDRAGALQPVVPAAVRVRTRSRGPRDAGGGEGPLVQLGDADGEARAWWGLANATYRRQDLERPEAAERAAAHFRKRGMRLTGWAVYTLGQLSAGR